MGEKESNIKPLIAATNNIKESFLLSLKKKIECQTQTLVWERQGQILKVKSLDKLRFEPYIYNLHCRHVTASLFFEFGYRYFLISDTVKKKKKKLGLE